MTLLRYIPKVKYECTCLIRKQHKRIVYGIGLNLTKPYEINIHENNYIITHYINENTLHKIKTIIVKDNNKN